MKIQSKGNFDTGEFEFLIDGESVLSIRLDELNQNSDSFVKGLNFELSVALEKAYETGKLDAMKAAVNAVRAL